MSKKYKCSSCVLYCEMDLEREPKYCMVDGDKANWEAVKEEKTVEPKKVQLPDWCKVGEWCYCLDDDGNPKYFKITNIKDNYIYGEDWDIDYHFVRQARLRPYNSEEMKALVGKVICTCEGKAFVVIAYADGKVSFGEVLHTAEDLAFDIYKFQDGSPCGVLEHLNEKGEWVE